MKKKILSSFLWLIGLFALASSVAFAATTIKVSADTALGEDEPGWLFNRDLNTSTEFEFNTDSASIGSGSLYVLPISDNPADKFVGENFINTKIANVNSINYDFKVGSGGTNDDKQHFYMNVYANFGVSADNKFYDCRYNVVPSMGSTTDFTTVTFDPNAVYPVTQSISSPFTCPASPADMDSLSANSTIRMFALNVGDTSANDQGLDGYLDKVVVNTDTDVTTYDFEPTVTPSPSPTPSVSPSPSPSTMPESKDDCKKGGWLSLFFGFRNQGLCVSSTVKNSHSNK
ncbi:hypothetical protein KJZ63_02070 [Patescibacteria group bacterium]|nr:hypothetical protein [Patescibacteria group bacterium]